MLRRPFLWTVDTFILQRGTENQAHCLARDHLVGCRDLFQHHLVGMDWFPVFQHLPDATMHAVGLSPSARLHGLDAISVAAFLATVAWGTLALRRAGHARLAMLFTLTIVAGPMLVYGHSSFGEMLAALLILAWQRPPSVGAGMGGRSAGLAASLTRRPPRPSCFALGVLGLDIVRTRRPADIRRAGCCRRRDGRGSW